MTYNLIAELVKTGIEPRFIAREISKVLGVSEKTARNKLNGKTDWTFPEAMKINAAFFDNKQQLTYLFEKLGSSPT